MNFDKQKIIKEIYEEFYKDDKAIVKPYFTKLTKAEEKFSIIHNIVKSLLKILRNYISIYPEDLEYY